MNDLSIPKECIKCKGTDIWWTNDEELIQAVELEMEDEDE